MQPDADGLLGVEQPRQLAQRHAVAHREIVAADIAVEVGIEDRAFDVRAGDRIGAVEDIERDTSLRGFFNPVEHRAAVGVESSADVLDVEDDGVEFLEHPGGHARATVAVEAPDGEAGGSVNSVGDVVGVDGSSDAVLWREQRHHWLTFAARISIDVAAAFTVDAGLVGD